MNVTKYDGLLFLYNFAVVLSGGYLLLFLDVSDRWAMVAIAFVLALVWTSYFRYGMIPRLAGHPRFGEDEDEDGSEAEGARSDSETASE